VPAAGADVRRLYNSDEEPHQDFDDLAGDVEWRRGVANRM
jgi:hypothetical protein